MGGQGRRNDRTLNTPGASRCWRRAVWLAVFALLLQTVAHLAPMPQRYVTPAFAEALHGDHHAASDHHGASDAPDPAGSLAHKCQICFTLQHAGTFVPPSASDRKEHTSELQSLMRNSYA